MNRGSERVPVESKLDALKDRERRQLLFALLGSAPDPGSSTELQELVAGDGGQLSLFMHHTHLPKLEELGFIEYDRERQRVSRGPAFEEIAPLLRLIQENREELPGEW